MTASFAVSDALQETNDKPLPTAGTRDKTHRISHHQPRIAGSPANGFALRISALFTIPSQID